ncbi:MAG: hypothetical protein ABEJ56_03920 [Candidatus Nanohaloarchaea archaeon]
MAGYDILTIEDYSSEEQIIHLFGNLVRESIKSSSYFSILLDSNEMLDRFHDGQGPIQTRPGFLEFLSNLDILNGKRVALSHSDDTSDVVSNVYLYKMSEDGLEEIDNISDEDIQPGTAAFGKPSKRYLREKHDFELHTFWDFR